MAKEIDEDGRDLQTVMVVEDDHGLANLYSLWLSDYYEVLTAYNGSEALEMLDETVDVLLLDRRMPDISGDEVLQKVREEGYDCQVSMVTAVPPGEEIADLPADEYLTKPLRRDRIEQAVDELFLRSNEDTVKQELLALISRKIALDKEKVGDHLAKSEEYMRLVGRIEEIMDRLEVTSQRTSSKYWPDACPSCGLRWDVTIEDTQGFIGLSSQARKCTRCGETARSLDPHDRGVARR